MKGGSILTAGQCSAVEKNEGSTQGETQASAGPPANTLLSDRCQTTSTGICVHRCGISRLCKSRDGKQISGCQELGIGRNGGLLPLGPGGSFWADEKHWLEAASSAPCTCC